MVPSKKMRRNNRTLSCTVFVLAVARQNSISHSHKWKIWENVKNVYACCRPRESIRPRSLWKVRKFYRSAV